MLLSLLFLAGLATHAPATATPARVGPLELTVPEGFAWSSATASATGGSVGAWPYDRPPPTYGPPDDGPPLDSFEAAVASQRPDPSAPSRDYAPPPPTLVTETLGEVRGRRAVALAMQHSGRDTTWTVVVDAGDAWLRVRLDETRPVARNADDAFARVAALLRFPGEAGFQSGFGVGPAAVAPNRHVRVGYARFEGPLGQLSVGVGDGRPGGVDTEARHRWASGELMFGDEVDIAPPVRNGARRVAGLGGGELATEASDLGGRSLSWQYAGPGPQIELSWGGSAGALADDLATWDALLDGARLVEPPAPAFGTVGAGDAVTDVPEGFAALGARAEIGGARIGVTPRWDEGLDARARRDAVRAWAQAAESTRGQPAEGRAVRRTVGTLGPRDAWVATTSGDAPDARVTLTVDAGDALVTVTVRGPRALGTLAAEADALVEALRTPADAGFGRAGWLYVGPVAFEVAPSRDDYAIVEARGLTAELWLAWRADGDVPLDAPPPPPTPPAAPGSQADLERAIEALRQDRVLSEAPRATDGRGGTQTVTDHETVGVPHARSYTWTSESGEVSLALLVPGGAPSPLWDALVGSLRSTGL